MYYTLGDIIRVENYKDSKNPLHEVDILLSSYVQALRSTISVVNMKSPVQLVFGTNMMMQVAIETDWKEILDCKQAQIIKNNKFENAKCIEQHYQIRNYVKITHEKNSRIHPTKLSAICEGPCRILIVHADSTASSVEDIERKYQ